MKKYYLLVALWFPFFLFAQKEMATDSIKTPSTSTKNLEEIVVVGSKADFRLDGEKKVFDVGKSISGVGGTAVDVIRNIPSLDVDVNGNVLFRGKSPRIFIDDKPTDLTLDEIPTSDIDKIEIISMPSARYAANASGGILNIVTKKNTKRGVNGMLMAGVDRLGGIRLGGNIDKNSEKWKLSLRAFLQQGKGVSTQHMNREIYSSSSKDSGILYKSDNDGNNDRTFLFVSPKVTYKVNPKTSLSLGGRLGFGDFNTKTTSSTQTDSSDYGVSNVLSQNRTSENKGNVNIYAVDLLLEQTLNNPSSKWSAFVRGQHVDVNRPTLVQTGSNQQLTTNVGTNRSLSASTDFTLALSKTSTLEFGSMFDWRDISFKTSLYENSIIKDFGSSAYTNTETIGALYGSFTHNIKAFSYQVGLRAESSAFEASVLSGSPSSSATSYSIDYPIVLFPSLSLQYQLSDKHQFQLMYARKIDRPNFFQTIPIKNYTDPLNITQGNPNLKPAFINLIEFTYNRSIPKWRKSSVLFSLYFKQTDDIITNYFKESTSTDNKKEIINTSQNSGNAQSAGIEITPRIVLNNWCNITPNINLLYGQVDLNDGIQKTHFSNLSYFIKLSQNTDLPKNWKLQFTAKYNSSSILPPNSSNQNAERGGPPDISSTAQGYIDETFEMGLGVEKSWKKKLFFSFNINDILGSNYKRISTSTEILNQYSSTLRNPYFASVNIRYVFNNQPNNPQKNSPQGKPNKEDGQIESY